MTLIRSDFRSIHTLPDYPESEKLEVPHLRNAGSSYARSFGARILDDFLDHLPAQWLPDTFYITARVQQLVKGLFASPPGYHLDHMPGIRSEEYLDPSNPSEHILCSIGHPGNAPIFALGEIEVNEEEVPLVHKNGLDSWHYQVEAAVQRGDMIEEGIGANTMVRYNWSGFHTARAAEADGLRVLLRASRARTFHGYAFNNTRFTMPQDLYCLENGVWRVAA